MKSSFLGFKLASMFYSSVVKKLKRLVFTVTLSRNIRRDNSRVFFHSQKPFLTKCATKYIRNKRFDSGERSKKCERKLQNVYPSII